MNPAAARRAIGILIVVCIVLSLGLTSAYVLRSRDLDRLSARDDREAAQRTRERNAQLTFLCDSVNTLVAAAIQIVDPPGAIPTVARMRARALLDDALCDPSRFRLDPP